MDLANMEAPMGREGSLDPWDVFKNKVCCEFDADPILFAEVIEKSSSQISDSQRTQISTANEYFQVLENNMSQKDLLEFMITLMDVLNLHVDQGSVRLADVLKRFKERLQLYFLQIDLQDKFIGRKKYLNEIKLSLPGKKGVWICGMGGMGKTTLATQVCKLLMKKYFIIRIDLKEISTLKEILKKSLLGMDELSNREEVIKLEEEENSLKEQFWKYINVEVPDDSIIFLDNVDDALSDREEVKVANFLLESAEISKLRLKFLVTCRRSVLECEYTAHRDDDTFHIVRLEKMLADEAVELFDSCSHPKVIERRLVGSIVEHCGYCPLAITTVASIVRYGMISPLALIENLKPTSRVGKIKEVSSLSVCLKQSFQYLNEDIQLKFLLLTLFKTAHFDLRAATCVFFGSIMPKNLAQTKIWLNSLKSRHLLESFELKKQEEYSLHPLVYYYLTERVQEAEKNGQQIILGELGIGRERFLYHYMEVIADIGKQIDSNSMAAQRIISHRKVHIKIFYDELLMTKSKNVMGKMRDVHSCRRISELADFIVDEDKIWEMIQKMIKQAKENDDKMGFIFWKTMEGTKLLCLSRNEHLKSKTLDEVDDFINTKKLVPSDYKQFPDWAAVFGQYYYLRSRYFYSERKFEEGIKNAKKSLEFYQKIKEDVHKNLLMHDYWNHHALVYNSLACCYYNLEGEENLIKAIDAYKHAIRKTNRKCKNNMNFDLPSYVCNLGVCLRKQGDILLQQGVQEKNEELVAAGKEKIEESVKIFSEAAQKIRQMNIDNMDIYARTLAARGESWLMLKQYEKACQDLREALDLRRKILPPPHEHLTLTTHKLARALYQLGIWLFHEGKKIDSLNTIWEAVMFYESTRDHIKNGGLPKNHPEYPKIKKFHIKTLIKTQEFEKIKKAEKFYRDYEAGNFDKHARKRRSVKEATKKRYTQKELYALIHAERTAMVRRQERPPQRPNSSSESSDSDFDIEEESDNNISDNDESLDSIASKATFNEEEQQVDFTSLLKKREDYMEQMRLERISQKMRQSLSVGEDQPAEEKDIEGKPKTEQVSHDFSVKGNNPTPTAMEVSKMKVKKELSEDDEVFAHPKLTPQESQEDIQGFSTIISQNVNKKESWRKSSTLSTSLELSMEEKSPTDERRSRFKREESIMEDDETVKMDVDDQEQDITTQTRTIGSKRTASSDIFDSTQKKT